MDPIELRSSQELDSFLSEFGSRGKLTSRGSSSNFRKESSASEPPSEKLSVASFATNNNTWKIQDFRKISSLASIKDVEEDKAELQNDALLEEGVDSRFLGSGTKDRVEGDDDGLPEKTDEGEESSGRHKFTGLGLALLGCLAFSLSSLIAKYFSEYHPLTKVVWRFQGLVIPALPMMMYKYYVKDDRIFDTVWPVCRKGNRSNIVMLMLRSTFGLATILLQFFSLQYITLADQIVLGSSQPVFVTIVAFFMLGEKCGIMSFVICTFTLMGVVVVAKPPIFTGEDSFDTNALIGSALAMASMAMSVMSIVFMRQLKSVHFTLITFSLGLYCSVVCGGAALAFNVFQFPVGRDHIILAIAFACLVFISQTCTTIALKYEQAGPVSVTRTSNIVFAFLWQWVFLGVLPDKLSLIGASIIAVGVILTALRKWVGMLPDEHPNRKRFHFLLK